MPPQHFQRFMEECLEGIRYEICVAYLDDVIVFSKTFEEHILHVQLVLQRLRSHGVKLKAQKVCYLGQIISAKGYRPDNLEAITSIAKNVPKKIGDMKRGSVC